MHRDATRTRSQHGKSADAEALIWQGGKVSRPAAMTAVVEATAIVILAATMMGMSCLLAYKKERRSWEWILLE